MNARVRDAHINMSHGSGGKAMHALIEDVFLGAFGKAGSDALEDSAILSLAKLGHHSGCPICAG